MPFPRMSNGRQGENVFVIAEIGKNFIQTEEDRPLEEYVQNALTLIDAAKDAGVDAVKFQTHEVEDEQLPLHVVSPHFSGMDRYRWVTRNTLATPLEFWQRIKAHCDARGIVFFTTPMSRKAAQKVEALVPFWKVGSADLQDDILLRYLISTKKPIIISTGMVSLQELDDAVTALQPKVQELAILYCVSHYPCPPEHFNLATLRLFRKKYPTAVIGFSDHSLGDDAALAAVHAGARIIEKHFSLSRDLWGPDHKASITPDEMRRLVDAIRANTPPTEDETSFFGKEDAELEGATNPYRPYFNKGLVAAEDIPKGTVLTENMIYAMRPLKHIPGLSAHRLTQALGKAVAKGLRKYDPIDPASLLPHP